MSAVEPARLRSACPRPRTWWRRPWPRRTGSDQCVVLVEETSEVEVRFANNTTTTNGSRRDRRVTVISMRQVEGGMAAGVARRGGDVDVGRAGAGGRAGRRRVAAGRRRQSRCSTPAEAAAGPARRHGSTSPQASTDLSVLSGVLAGLSAAFERARRADHVAGRLRRAPADHRVPGHLHRAPAGPRPARRGRCTWWPGAPTGPAPPGPGPAPPTSPTCPSSSSRPRCRNGWPGRPGGWSGRPGRYEVLLPPEAVSDLMVGLAYELSGRDAEDGRTVFSSPGGGTRVGEQLAPVPFDLRSDPGRARAGVRAVPHRRRLLGRHLGLRQRAAPRARPTWIAGGRLERLRYHRAGAAALGGGAGRLHRQPVARGARGHRLGGGAGGPDRAGPPAHLPLVHPGGGPGHHAAHRAHPGRRLRGGGRCGGRGGQQLPLQREPGRPPGPGHRGRGQRAGPGSGVRRVLQPDPACPPSGSPTST